MQAKKVLVGVFLARRMEKRARKEKTRNPVTGRKR
jgi:hypothetical protein